MNIKYFFFSEAKRRDKSARGFSLPEVAIAVGVAAMALVSIMGIIPSGLDSIRMAGEMSANARLIAQVTSELQASDWGEYKQSGNSWTRLAKTMNGRWYFDDQANIIETDDSNFDQRIAYVVRVVQSSSELLLPGAEDASKNTLAVQIEVATSTDRNFTFMNKNQFVIQPAILTRQYSTESTSG